MKRKTLVLSLSQIDMELDNVTFWQLTRDEAERLMTFYYTYEFADNFFLLPSQNENYAFLYNFVKTGILSVEEFFQVLLN